MGNSRDGCSVFMNILHALRKMRTLFTSVSIITFLTVCPYILDDSTKTHLACTSVRKKRSLA